MRCAARDLQTGQEESRRPAHPNQTDLDPHHPGEPHRSVSMVMGCHGVEGWCQTDRLWVFFSLYLEAAGVVMEKLSCVETT